MDPHRLRAALAVAVVVVLTAAIPASATPTAVTFHLVGTHPPDADYHQEPSRRHRRCARQEHGRATAKGAASSPAPTVPEPLAPTSSARSSTRPARAAPGRSPPARAHTAPCAALAARQSTRQPAQTATRSHSPTPGEGSSTSTTSRQRSRCAGRRQRDLGRGAATCSASRSHVPTTWPGTTSPTPCSSARLRRIWPSARERRPQPQASRSGFGRREARASSASTSRRRIRSATCGQPHGASRLADAGADELVSHRTATAANARARRPIARRPASAGAGPATTTSGRGQLPATRPGRRTPAAFAIRVLRAGPLADQAWAAVLVQEERPRRR